MKYEASAPQVGKLLQPASYPGALNIIHEVFRRARCKTLPINPFTLLSRSRHYNTSCKLVICASQFFYKRCLGTRQFCSHAIHTVVKGNYVPVSLCASILTMLMLVLKIFLTMLMLSPKFFYPPPPDKLREKFVRLGQGQNPRKCWSKHDDTPPMLMASPCPCVWV